MMRAEFKHVASPALLLLLETALFLLLIAFLGAESGWLLLPLVLAAGAGAYVFITNGPVKAALGGLFQRNAGTAVAGLIFLLAVFPLVMRSSPYWIFIAVMAGLYAMVGLGLNIELGGAGLINLAGAAFYGIGAYASALLALRAGWPAALAIPAGGAAAAVLGVVLFVPIMKTRGHYLALVTIAFGLIVNLLLEDTGWTGGPQGLKSIPGVTLGGCDLTSALDLGGLHLPYYTGYFYLVAAAAGLTVFVSARLRNSWTGLTWAGIRDDEISARCCGIGPNGWKLGAFIAGNFFIGLAGALYAHLVGFISPPDFTFGDSLIMLCIVILGGMDNPAGVILGAGLLVILPEKLRMIQEYRFLLYGLVIITMIIFRPRGLLPSKIRDYGLPHERD